MCGSPSGFSFSASLSNACSSKRPRGSYDQGSTAKMLRAQSLLEPGREEALNLAAAARLLEPGRQLRAFDHRERRHVVHTKPRREDRLGLDVDTVELERLVVSPTLKHLREECLDAPAAAGARAEEEDQARLRLRHLHCTPITLETVKMLRRELGSRQQSLQHQRVRRRLRDLPLLAALE